MRADGPHAVRKTGHDVVFGVPRLIGNSAALQRLEEALRAAARCDAKVLITGESGAGKEVAARVIHAGSARASAPFLAINCAAVSESLLESELFGHVRGSFTGAVRDRAGLLESAHRGTLLMDEIGEMPLRMQGLLLRFLETGEIQRVGDDRPMLRRDVRVIAATNRDLADAVAAGTFRRDLYYRLNVLSIVVPPLRERREDVPALVRAFLQEACAAHRVPRAEIADEALERLAEYDWPGNVRELRNFVERLVVGRRGDTIGVDDLPAEITSVARVAPAPAPAAPRHAAAGEALLDRMVNGRQSFWTAVYDPFMAHDLTRNDVLHLLRHGLDRTRGNVPLLLQLFNLEPSDQDRFLAFLRKHHCLLPQQGRALKAGLAARPPVRARDLRGRQRSARKQTVVN
jgi:DNA-binding NtrC family response regulator